MFYREPHNAHTKRVSASKQKAKDRVEYLVSWGWTIYARTNEFPTRTDKSTQHVSQHIMGFWRDSLKGLRLLGIHISRYQRDSIGLHFAIFSHNSIPVFLKETFSHFMLFSMLRFLKLLHHFNIILKKCSCNIFFFLSHAFLSGCHKKGSE